VDCDPNPNLAESFGLDSGRLPRFAHEGGLRRTGETLELAAEPRLVETDGGVAVLGGPPSRMPLADAIARGIAGVLLADRFDVVITDLGAGPELTRAAVGGKLDPADLCLVVVDGTPSAERVAGRIEAACEARGVTWRRVLNRRGEATAVARELADAVA
jgi:CO dehydrogenase nickel-insertion accessory protein CooC1